MADASGLVPPLPRAGATAPRETPKEKPSNQVTEVYDKMRGFLKGTHWSKPYYSALMHNNPQLPFELLEHVNCTYLSTPGRAPTLLALKQHTQSLVVLISMLAPAQNGGTFEPPHEGRVNGDAPFAAGQAYDWLNDLESHYKTDDAAHKKPLNALLNLVKSNSDTEGPKWHCPLDTTGIEHAEKHPLQQYRPYESHLTLLMHANEILERLDHEYSAMGGILGILPLDSDHIVEERALTQAKETLVGQWILYTQHLVVRMHELEIAYGNALDLLAGEAIIPMQHMSVHGPDGRSGREIVFPQDRWIMANAGEDVFTFIHQLLDRAEAHQNAQDDVFLDQSVLGDAALTTNREEKYRGIVKVDLNTRFYRLRNSGRGPLFVLPAFGDRPNTLYTRDMENRPTVIAIPQPNSRETVTAWEARHRDMDNRVMKLTAENSVLKDNVRSFETTIRARDGEIKRLQELQTQYDDQINQADRDLAQELVSLQRTLESYRDRLTKGGERENILKKEIENYKQANIAAQGENNNLNTMVDRINQQQSVIGDLRAQMKERDDRIVSLTRDNDTLRIMSGTSVNNPAPGNPEQLAQLQAQLALSQEQRQHLQQEVHILKQSKGVKGKILNFPDSFKFEYGSAFEDGNLGITACSTEFYNSLIEAERQRNTYQQQLDQSTQRNHDLQTQLDRVEAEADTLRADNQDLRNQTDACVQQRTNLEEQVRILQADNQSDQVAEALRLQTELGTVTKELSDTKQRYDQLVASERNLRVEVGSLRQQLVENAPTAQASAPSDDLATLQLKYEQLQQSEGILRGEVASLTQQLIASSTSTLQTHAGTSSQEVNDLQEKNDQLEATETDLRNEIQALREELAANPRRGAPRNPPYTSTGMNTTTTAPCNDSDEIKALKREVELYKTELGTVQELWNDMQNKYLELQKTMQAAGMSDTSGTLQERLAQLQKKLDDAKRDCETEKADLRQKLADSEQSIKALQMKVLAEPSKLQPVIIELEAQRDAARAERNQMRENIRVLEERVRNPTQKAADDLQPDEHIS